MKFFICFVGLVAIVGCTTKDASDTPSNSGNGSTTDVGTGDNGSGQSKTIGINGSSTVFLITQAVAEEFEKSHEGLHVTVGKSGTGGGFKQFVVGQTDINDASRPIKESEKALCAENGIEFIELKIAIDGLTVVVHPENDWCDCLTTEELEQIWTPESKVRNWSDVRADWPAEPIKLYGPDSDSGTFDYFTEEICGESGKSRTDYMPSADDNVLVRGVSGDRYSLGYFGYAYYTEQKEKLNSVAITSKEHEAECVSPTDENIESGKYAPLSRPLFLYINKASLKRPEVAEFMQYYLAEGQNLAKEVGYVALDEKTLAESKKLLESAIDTTE